jgi:hypothetical protein
MIFLERLTAEQGQTCTTERTGHEYQHTDTRHAVCMCLQAKRTSDFTFPQRCRMWLNRATSCSCIRPEHDTAYGLLQGRAVICLQQIRWRLATLRPLQIRSTHCETIRMWETANRYQPSGYSVHRTAIHKFYVLPTQCIYVFCVDLRTNSDYFPIQH